MKTAKDAAAGLFLLVVFSLTVVGIAWVAIANGWAFYIPFLLVAAGGLIALAITWAMFRLFS